MRLLGLAQGDPGVPTAGPGATSKFLFDALARRYDLVDRRGVDLSPLQRYLAAAVTVHPSRDKWTTRLYWRGRLALKLRTLNSRRTVRRIDEPFDLVVQVYGLFRTSGAPYVLYVDNTIQLSRRHWPEWVAVEGQSLSRLYAWERRLFRDARHVFTLGKPAARSLVDFYGVPEEQVSVVGGGASFDALPEPPQGARDPVVLFVGSDWRRKGGAPGAGGRSGSARGGEPVAVPAREHRGRRAPHGLVALRREQRQRHRAGHGDRPGQVDGVDQPWIAAPWLSASMEGPGSSHTVSEHPSPR